MALRELIQQVGEADYDYRGDRQQPVFEALRGIASELVAAVPSHFLVPISEGVGNLPRGLWVSILDPDVTTTPTKGTYVVFLFDEARRRVSLSLNQGVTDASDRARELGIPAKDLLRREAESARVLLASFHDLGGIETTIRLGKSNLMSKYEAGNICARTWNLDDLPIDDELMSEVGRFLSLYSDVVPLRETAVLTGKTELPPRDLKLAPTTHEREFKPKSDSDYRARIGQAEQVRSRSHERLVARLGAWALPRGFEPNTKVHPRDLVLHREPGSDCLVEVKVFPPGKPRAGLRECIGQLIEYRHFYHRDESPALIAALSEHPGDAYIDLLHSLDIAVVWPPTPDRWSGCGKARELGLVD